MTFFGLSILFLACGDKSNDTSEDTGSDNGVSFAGMDFVLDSATGYEPTGDSIYLSFGDDASSISFTGGCNHFSGSFEMEGDTLAVGMLSGTEIGCGDGLMEQDDWFVSFFTASPTVEHNGDTITFTGSDATLVYLDEDIAVPDASLTAETWYIDTYIDGGVASAFNIGVSPSMTFGDDGSISVNTGCNDGGGTYIVEGDQLTVSIDTITDAVCEGDLAYIEGHILSVLNGAATYSIDGNQLSIDNGSLGIGAHIE
ncbi:MAG: META domain-containing protein [Myxococcota bacterium]|nr:META domain-containing protein [Myxococcota bacterium]